MDYGYSSVTDFGSLWLGLLLTYLWIMLVVILVVYVYTSLVLMTIAKKTNTANAWLAWIPIGNLYLLTQVAKVPWWTFLVIFLAWIPFVGSLAIFAVLIWWWWKICEHRNRPGWWSLLVTFVPVVNVVMLGILAWSDAPTVEKPVVEPVAK